MNKKPFSTLMTRLCWGAFFLVLLFLAFDVVPRALGQRDASKRSVTAHMSQVAQPSQSHRPDGSVCQYTIAGGTNTIVPGDTDTGSHCDDCDTLVALPFSFQLYDQTFAAVNVSSNGRLDFVVPNESFTTSCLPAPPDMGPYDFTIFALWHDQRTDLGLNGCAGFPGGTCGIFTSVSGSAPDRVFNIEFRTVRFEDFLQTENYEVRLYENPALNKRFDVIYGTLNGVLDHDTAGVQGDAAAGFLTQDLCNTPAPQNVSRTYTAGPCGPPTPTPGCTSSGWFAGPDLPSVGVRFVGVYFPANGRFYAMGGRSSDAAGSEFTNPFEYDPNTNAWTTKAAIYPDNGVNNMACGVLTEAGTPYIYCVGGSAATQTTATARVFRYSPVFDTITSLDASDNWPGDAAGTILPGGFAVVDNKLYILGGFNINVASTSEIWEFDPTAAQGSRWLQRANTPEGVMFAPTCAIGGIIYVGGASDYQGGIVVDTTNSFIFNPATNTIGTIAAIPRATGETRALNFNGLMLVMGGGRVAPNPSTEVDVYDPGTNTWTIGTPFTIARRNFAVDTDGSTHIWLAGGYDLTGVPVSSMEIFCEPGPTPTPTPTVTPTVTPTATPSTTPTATPSGTPTPSPTPTPSGTPASQAVNLSTRMLVETGDGVGIGGFIITGTIPKHVVLRAIGPSLTQHGVPNALADPVLELHGPGGFVTITNNNWRDTQEAQIQADGLAPSNDLESAIDVTIAPGAYTGIVRGNNNTSGVGLIEIYDLNPSANSKLGNISSRAFVSTGDNIVIAGFILGHNSGMDSIVVRGIGPSLTAFGVTNALADPRLELHDGNGALLMMNNNWQDDPAQAMELTAAGLALTNDLESGIAIMLPPGLYTALLAGVNDGTGVGLVEVYDRGLTASPP